MKCSRKRDRWFSGEVPMPEFPDMFGNKDRFCRHNAGNLTCRLAGISFQPAKIE
jgi:hypothetical protein